MAERQGRQGRARQEDRKRPLYLAERPRGQSQGRRCRAAAGHDRPVDPADARRLRHLPARRHRRRRRDRRRRDDFRHRLCSLSWRADALCARPRGRQGARYAQKPGAEIRAAFPARSGLGFFAMIHSGAGPARFSDPVQLADAIVDKVGKTIVLALPLGLGKANHIANALYAKAAADRSINLTIFTALTLEAPRAKSELERRFLDPIAQRLFAGYPPLAYAAAVHNSQVPPNIMINEFFFEAGQWLGSPYAQQHYISANYTHALRYVLDRGVNVVGQLVAHRPAETAYPFSLSCNPDLTCDLLKLRRDGKADFLFCGQTNSELPFMRGDAVVAANEFDLLLDSPKTDFPLFAPPREPVSLADYAAGLHAAGIVPDGGTLQIGIGSLGDAVAQALVLRQRQNGEFCRLLAQLGSKPGGKTDLRSEPFDIGLYGCSELFVEGMLDLYRAGILKREVDGVVLHGGFFVGSRAFYRALRDMLPEISAKFGMTSISFVNEIYHGEDKKRRARVNARFLNDAMMATLLGDVISDALEDGRVVSGVGGQYNFIAQGFALDGARSAILLQSTRTAGGKTQSNIRWRYGHTTIPRHLRDIIIT